MKKKIDALLAQGKAKKHATYAQTGLVSVNLEKVAGGAGTDVTLAFLYPEGKVDIVAVESWTHYGYGRVGDDDHIYDLSNRAEFAIV